MWLQQWQHKSCTILNTSSIVNLHHALVMPMGVFLNHSDLPGILLLWTNPLPSLKSVSCKCFAVKVQDKLLNTFFGFKMTITTKRSMILRHTQIFVQECTITIKATAGSKMMQISLSSPPLADASKQKVRPWKENMATTQQFKFTLGPSFFNFTLSAAPVGREICRLTIGWRTSWIQKTPKWQHCLRCDKGIDVQWVYHCRVPFSFANVFNLN